MTHRVNYFYFGAFFLFLVILCSSSIFTKEPLNGAQVFFFFYAIGQVILEIILLTVVTFGLRRYFGKLASALFIGVTFFGLFLHIFDFLMDRILNLSVWEVLNVIVFHENIHNFLFLLDASGIALWVWFCFFGLLSALPILGIYIYRITDHFALKRPLVISNGLFLQTLLCIPVALLFWEISAFKMIHPDAYPAFKNSLPWKFTFLQPQNTLANLPGTLKIPIQEDMISQIIEKDETHLQKRPNIFLFIVESLREDCITNEITPNLAQFKNHAVHFDQAMSGGNGTHISWFSIFHSQFPFHWKLFQKSWKTGSPALQLLKKWGYKIHLYSSAQLSYYGMQEVLFGKDTYLLDSKNLFLHAPPKTAADSDNAAITSLQEDLQKHPEWKEGQVFIIFWDCTHFDYSWPKNWSPKFVPFAQEFAYFKAVQSQKVIQAIKNRYLNAVHYMDHLFGKFAKNLDQDAVVVFTGDHGEEFFDHGHLFHGSHLTKEQINVPLYFKFGKSSQKVVPRAIISQMDIFPSIINYLSGHAPNFLEGNSLFQKPKFPFALTARFNAGCTPYEFAIHNGQHKLIAQFSNRRHIFDSIKLKIISLKTKDEKRAIVEEEEAWIKNEFGDALNYLFIPGRKADPAAH